MTEIEKKAEERCSELAENNCEYKTFWLDGYEQGMKSLWCCEHSEEICCVLTDSRLVKQENELLKSKIKNVYEVRQKVQSEIIIELEIEIEGLKKAITEKNSVIEKMKCCENCKHNQNKLEDNEVCWNCERQCSKLGEEVIKDEWELAE